MIGETSMTTKRRQRGISLFGVLFWGAILAGLFLIGVQVLPTVTEYREIRHAADRAAAGGSTVPEIRAAFDKQVQAGYISSIGAKDLQITKDANGRVVVGFAYEKKIPLFGPVSLVIDYSGSSTAQ